MHDKARIRQRIKEIFHAASLLPREKQEQFVRDACSADSEDSAVESEVLSLLAELPAADGFLDGSTGGAAAMATAMMADGPRNGEGVGAVIGRYHLLEQIGEGGFGLVYMAQQEQPLRRRVALKIIKLGMDTNQVIARFEQERQALAMMDHPHIARVFDAGATPAGRPYFVMELVRGEPITDFCDARSMGIAERLALFAQVCDAIQHAHQKGIIHRDLKPSNVLVTIGDGDRPMPKVIDFGIAKATQSRLTERTFFTEFRQMIGTPAYMSPEQAGMGGAGGLDIDTRSDVYALGALLYELLTGETPFDAQRLREAGFGEIQRIIREDEPPRPSTRVSTSGTLAHVAARRSMEPRRLGLLVRGELDWIVMRCLEKDRARRYAGADDLARDLRRYLSQEPLEAGPPSVSYRASKFVRRNRRAVIAGATLALALLLGLIGTTLGAVWALQERDQARASQDRAVAAQRMAEDAAEAEALLRVVAERARETEALQRDIAEREAEGNRTVTAFFTQVLSLANPTDSGHPDITVRDLLIAAERKIDSALAQQPRAEAHVRLAIGRAYIGISELQRAETMLRRAVSLLRDHDPENIAGRYEAHLSLDDALAGQQIRGSEDLTSALRLGAAMVEAQYPRTAELMHEVINGFVARQSTRLFASVDRLRDHAPREMAADSPLWEPVCQTLWLGGMMSYELRRFDECVDIMSTLDAWSEGNPAIAAITRLRWRSELAAGLAATGRWSESDVIYRESLEFTERALPSQHIYVAIVRGLAAQNLIELGLLAEADHLFAQACDWMIRAQAICPDGDRAFAKYIRLLEQLDRPGDAAAMRHAFAELINLVPVQVSWEFGRLAIAPERAGVADAAEAVRAAMQIPQPDAQIEAVYEEFHTLWKQMLPDAPVEAAMLALYVVNWSDAYERPDPAIRRRLCLDGLNVLQETGAIDGRALISAYRELHKHAMREGDFAAAETFARSAWSAARSLWGEHFHSTVYILREVGSALARQGRHDEAQPLLVSAYRDLEAGTGNAFGTRFALRSLVTSYFQSGDIDAATHLMPALAKLFSNVETGLPVQDDGSDYSTPGLSMAVIESVNRDLAGAIAALHVSAESAAADRVQRAEAVIAERYASGPDSDDSAALAYASLLVDMVRNLLETGRAFGALVPLLVDARDIAYQQAGSLAWLSIHADRRLIELFLACGQPEEAVERARDHAGRITKSFGADNETTSIADAHLAMALRASGDFDGAYDVVMRFFPKQMNRAFHPPVSRDGFQMLCEFAATPRWSEASLPVILDCVERLSSLRSDLRRDYAWYIARQSGLPEAVYAGALRLAESAGTTGDADPLVLRAVGAAHYRLGAHEASTEHLRESIRLMNETQSPVGEASGDAAAAHLFLALARHALGDEAEFAEHLHIGRTLFADRKLSAGDAALLAEAEALAVTDADDILSRHFLTEITPGARSPSSAGPYPRSGDARTPARERHLTKAFFTTKIGRSRRDV